MCKMDKTALLRLSVFFGFLITVLICCRFSVFAMTADQLREDTLRLHIRANSDSAEDQRLKLCVRDAVLQQMGPLFAESSSKEGAVEKARNSLETLESLAETTLAEQGCFLPVKARVVRMYFDTTEYEDFTLPAGEYDALRLEIGSGEGHNWFCVLYPGLCLPAAEGESLYPEPARQHLVEKTPQVRFAALELLEHLRESLKNSSEK